MQAKYPFIAIDPVVFSLGPFDVHWYGIMYLLAFGFFWAAGNWVAKNRAWWGWSPQAPAFPDLEYDDGARFEAPEFPVIHPA